MNLSQPNTRRSRAVTLAAVCGLLVAVALFALAMPAVVQGRATPVTIVVDTAARRQPINPLIYGVAHATPAELEELNAPLHRLGGNHTSRYNWEANAYNRGADWYFESVGEAGVVPGDAADVFVRDSRASAAAPMITVPMIGWVARLGPGRSRLASFSVSRYGPQTGRDGTWFPDAGNGVRPGGALITGNDPNDANQPSDARFQQAWVRHLTSRWRGAADGGVRYYVLDNEPSLWHVTHRDVRPNGASLDDVRAASLEYATAIKAVDPAAQVVGPEEWGWLGFLYSGADQQWGKQHGWRGELPDRTRHGGRDALPWLLDQWRRHAEATGVRPVDVVSVHHYPQGGEYSTDTSLAMQQRRNRSTRALWDPAYVDESWIGERVRLIPRLREWVDTHYARGVPIALTEYSWGAERHISGALAQADVLGILGREGLDMAARWATPDASTPTFKAMKLFRNYDGRRSTFGDVSVGVTGPDPDEIAAFAAERRLDGAVTVMVINKRFEGATPVALALARPARGRTAQRWQLDAGNEIRRLPDVSVEPGGLSIILDPRSITLLVIGAGL